MSNKSLLNEHKKSEFLPALTGNLYGYSTVGSKFMVVLSLIVVSSLFWGCSSSKLSQNSFGFCPTYQYEGVIIDSEGNEEAVGFSLMTLLDSTTLGTFYFDSLPKVTHTLGGSARTRRALSLGESMEQNLLYLWEVKKSNGGKRIKGTRTEISSGKEWRLVAEKVFGKSYWDYIRKNRGYYEYTDLYEAIRHKDDVLSLDVARQGLTHLPDELAQLSKIESINLLGNALDTFPIVLAQMKTLDEISLCANGMEYVGSEIGELGNLRILIINGNNLHTLPKEIGELTNLLYLDLSDNPLDTLPEEIKNLTKLQELHLENWQPSSQRFSDEYKKHLQELLPSCRIHFDKNDW